MKHARDRPFVLKGPYKKNKNQKNTEEYAMAKKVISIALVIITIFSTMIITTNAASYSTGEYEVASSSGLNIRPSINSSSRYGAASKGTRFKVTQVSGNWGYTPSVKCANGKTVSGWVCLDYCSYKGSGNSQRATYNDIFTSLKGSGYSLSQARNYQATSFKKGDFVYLWAYLHDANDNLYKTYGSGTCNMTLSIYRPDGTCAYTYTYKNCDNNWIGQRLDQTGTWTIQSKITGSLSGTNTGKITVKENTATKYYTLTYNMNGGSGSIASQRVSANTSFRLSSTKPTRSGYTFLGWSTSKSATTASYAPGTSIKLNGNVTLYAVWRKNATVTYTLTYNLNGGSGSIASQKVNANTSFKLSSTKPTRSGYTFLGWSTSKSATTASYAPGTSVKISGNVTLYAVWKKNPTVNNVSYYAEITANGGLILRSGIGTSYSKLLTIPKGTVIKITQESNGWGKTTYNGKTGWVSLTYIRKTSTNSSVKIKLNVPHFKQTDSRWKNVYIGNKTIGNVGCLTTAIAMVYSYNTNKTVYPNTMRNMLSYSNNDLYWSSLSKVGLTSITYNSAVSNSMLSTIYSKLKQGRPVIIGAKTSSGGSQHWVVITGYTGNSTTSFSTADFTVNDPGVQGSTTLKAFLANGSKTDRTRIIRIIY